MMWDLEVAARERYRDFQREINDARETYNAVHSGGNGAGSRDGRRNPRQRLGHSLVRAGAVIAGDPNRTAR